MSLPPPAENQAFCKVSALEGGIVTSPTAFFLDPDPGEHLTLPSLCFLVRHSTLPETIVFDLGVHKDWATHVPEFAELVRKGGNDMTAPQDVAESLVKGGLDPADVTYVCISHIHIDHVGDPSQFPNATFIVGAGARELPDHTTGQTQEFSTKCFEAIPKERVNYLDLSSAPPIGPFGHAHDFFGDGSLYIVDAPGHLPGHVNILARTSADGGWIFLAADSAHDWRLIKGESKVARKPACAHVDVAKAEAHISDIARLWKENKRAHVMLAHDLPWYEKNKGGDAFWPGVIPPL
ncbi:Metallo-hydrolase/oxidoreductase [Lentinus tigrinus ALCF2SS1-7]|uniref:Metallo-hydrolase/oxidoreductase n=1 Tax=Lentinus tigrinus ALCF2SS1-7 TaxID=1328758 RepID=UPI001165D882|nr:Metallo-hydrolase/oxidoreductase [Lentinus tigrinus ALCF2SS1-7]